MNFTPGPWYLGPHLMPYGAMQIRDERGYEICCVSVLHPAKREADAKLIAAAPDLYAACKAMLLNIDHWLVTGTATDAEEAKRLHGLIEAAVAKAGGKGAGK